MIIKNNKRTNIIYKGNNVVQRIYKGTDKVFEYLPKNYTVCSYLRSTGTQYIDTSVIPDNYSGNYSVELTMQVETLPSSGVSYVCGCGTGTGRSCNVYVTTQASMGIYGGKSSATIAVSINATQADVLNKNTYKYVMVNEGNSKIIKGGTTYTGSVTATTTSTVSLYLFRSRFGTDSNSPTMKLYGCKIWDNNNNLVRYFIPCLDNNNVPCLYDLITKTAYYNAGTGTFDYA